MAAKGKVSEPTEPDPERDSPPSDELLVRVYDELRCLARNYLRRERVDHTLQPTALGARSLLTPRGAGWYVLAQPRALRKRGCPDDASRARRSRTRTHAR